MAQYGLSTPVIAQLDVETGKYSKGFVCGKAVSTDVNPNYNEGSVYGDNELAEYAKVFKDADVNLGVTQLPIESATVVFGHTVAENTIKYNVNDESNFVGYGFFATEQINGKITYTACWLPKVKFAEGAESYTTRGENIEFKTPTLSGKATADKDGQWRYKETGIATLAEAIAWLKEKAGIVDAAGSNNVTGDDES